MDTGLGKPLATLAVPAGVIKKGDPGEMVRKFVDEIRSSDSYKSEGKGK